jgi:cyanophycinase-like exopeptidase
MVSVIREREQASRSLDSQSLESASTVELIGRAVDQTSLIIRQELALAKAELALKAKRATFGVVLSAGAALMALIALLCAVGAAVAGLAGVVPVWAAALIVAGGLVCVAGIAGFGAMRAFAKASPSTPPDAVASVKADVTEVKEHFRR